MWILRISNDRKFICFVCLNCHFIFKLFIEGNIVSNMEYVSRKQKYLLSSALMAVSVGRMM